MLESRYLGCYIFVEQFRCASRQGPGINLMPGCEQSFEQRVNQNFLLR